MSAGSSARSAAPGTRVRRLTPWLTPDDFLSRVSVALGRTDPSAGDAEEQFAAQASGDWSRRMALTDSPTPSVPAPGTTTRADDANRGSSSPTPPNRRLLPARRSRAGDEARVIPSGRKGRRTPAPYAEAPAHDPGLVSRAARGILVGGVPREPGDRSQLVGHPRPRF